jgi:hypothetical protein
MREREASAEIKRRINIFAYSNTHDPEALSAGTGLEKTISFLKITLLVTQPTLLSMLKVIACKGLQHGNATQHA